MNALDVATISRPRAYSVSAATNFRFKTSSVPASYLTALRCRYSAIRREAIALLSRNLPRERLWNLEQYRILAERVVQIEEMHVDGEGWPLEQVSLWSGSVMPDAGEESGFRAEFLFARDVGRGIGKMGSSEEKKGLTVRELYVDVPAQRDINN